ncbi:MAG: SH3 domain-containing protein [Clostridia bacterium]|nr:SH3 domain-containing protein [Clostridia bacterium]
MKKRIVAIACLVALLMASIIPMASAAEHFFVKTGNGRTLNLRADCCKGDNIVGHLPYGREVVLYEYNANRTWAYVESGNLKGWVQTSFLSKTNPGAYVPQPGKEGTVKGGHSFKEINTAAKAIKVLDEPYDAVVKTHRAASLVHLRMFPDKNAAYTGLYLADTELEVLAQSKTWAQVRVKEDGKVGFLLRKNITALD